MPLERLEHELTELAAHINAATGRWLGLLAEFDRREAWGELGAKSCGQWLSHRCGISPAAAREQVRVARRLSELPKTRATFERGELCYSQVRALTRVATPDTEEELLRIAHYATAAQLEVVVRAYRGVLRDELEDAVPEHERRYVRFDHDDDGSLLIRARLPAEEGALMQAAFDAARDALREARATAPTLGADPAGDPAPGRLAPSDNAAVAGAPGSASAETTQIGDNAGATGLDLPERGDHCEDVSQRKAVSNADACVLMAQTFLVSGAAERSGGHSYQVVVHVDAAALERHGVGSCELEQGPSLHPETARRLACDASIVRILERDGRPLSVGRRSRAVPTAMERALRSRDRVCRFPGCCQRRFLHNHHVEHWARGGRTELQNLIRLCSFHHHLIHEGGYTLERSPTGALVFRRPDGSPIPTAAVRRRGHPRNLARSHRTAGVRITPDTCQPELYGDRLHLAWTIDSLVQTDTRLRE